MPWSELANIATVITGLVALVGVPAALVSYHRSRRAKRAEWLASLHEKFFESDRYTRVRRVLDYRDEPAYSQLAAAVTAGTTDPLVDELYRYLNFFELLAGLEDLGEISRKEIHILFDYDLRNLALHQFIVDKLDPEGFERLSELVRSLKPVPRA